MKIKLTNELHKTEVSIKAYSQNILREGEKKLLKIGDTTYRKIIKTLCGVKDCQCGLNPGCPHVIRRGFIEIGE